MKTNIEKLPSLIIGYDSPKKLWRLGVSTTVYPKNRFFIKAIQEDITPIEKLINTAIDLSHLHI